MDLEAWGCGKKRLSAGATLEVENWQVFLATPLRKREEGSVEAIRRSCGRELDAAQFRWDCKRISGVYWWC